MSELNSRGGLRLFALGFLLLVAGCCSIPEAYRPVAEFQRKHPQEYRKYAYLNPISLNTYKCVWADGADLYGTILQETRRRFGENDVVKEFINRMSRHAMENRERILNFCRDLEQASSNGGAICQYEWSDGKTRETGFLVLKFGEVVMREPWITDFLSEQQEDGELLVQ